MRSKSCKPRRLHSCGDSHAFLPKVKVHTCLMPHPTKQEFILPLRSTQVGRHTLASSCQGKGSHPHAEDVFRDAGSSQEKSCPPMLG